MPALQSLLAALIGGGTGYIQGRTEKRKRDEALRELAMQLGIDPNVLTKTMELEPGEPQPTGEQLYDLESTYKGPEFYQSSKPVPETMNLPMPGKPSGRDLMSMIAGKFRERNALKDMMDKIQMQGAMQQQETASMNAETTRQRAQTAADREARMGEQRRETAFEKEAAKYGETPDLYPDYPSFVKGAQQAIQKGVAAKKAGTPRGLNAVQAMRAQDAFQKAQAIGYDPSQHITPTGEVDLPRFEAGLSKKEKGLTAQKALQEKNAMQQRILMRVDPTTGLTAMQRVAKVISEELDTVDLTDAQRKTLIKQRLNTWLASLGFVGKDKLDPAVHEAVRKAVESYIQPETGGNPIKGVLDFIRGQ